MFSKKPFSFSADCKTLEQSIKKVVAVVTPNANFFLAIYKKDVCLIGMATDAFILLKVPNSETQSADGIFAFNQANLAGLIKNRSLMDFKYSGTECLYKQQKGNYNGKIATIDVTDDQITQITDKVSGAEGTTQVSSAVLAKIRQGVTSSSVRDVYQGTTLLSFVSVSQGRLIVTTFDAQHFGLYRTKIDDSKLAFRAALPHSHFTTIDSLADGNAVKLAITQSSLRALGKGFVAVLPATQSDDKHYDLVPTFLKSLPTPEFEADFEVSKLLAVAENLLSIYNANTNVQIKTKGNSMNLSISASSGSASDTVKVLAKGSDLKLAVDPRLLIDILLSAKSFKKPQLRITDKVITIANRADGAEVFLACSRAE